MKLTAKEKAERLEIVNRRNKAIQEADIKPTDGITFGSGKVPDEKKPKTKTKGGK